MRKLVESIVVLMIGSVLYSVMEILFRGYTHWSMTITGGVCFFVLYDLHIHHRGLSLLRRAVLGACFITAAEFAVGCIVNLFFGWDVWDYSDQPLHLLGQVCPSFSACWLILAALADPICRHIHREITISEKNPRRLAFLPK